MVIATNVTMFKFDKRSATNRWRFEWQPRKEAKFEIAIKVREEEEELFRKNVIVACHFFM